MNSSFDNLDVIDIKSWQKLDNIDLIIVDKKISNTIIWLNKLGYITKYCCEGHFFGNYYYEQVDCDNEFLETVINNSNCTIVEKNEDTFDYVSKERFTDIYIMFESDYNFDNLPEGFVYQDKRLSHLIKFINDDGSKKEYKEIINEIDKYNKILGNWAMNLPKIRKDDK